MNQTLRILKLNFKKVPVNFYVKFFHILIQWSELYLMKHVWSCNSSDFILLEVCDLKD